MSEKVGGIQVDVSLDDSRVDPELSALNSKLNASAGGVGKLGGALDDSSKKGAAFTRSILEASRGIEDFATGGFIGILNNIPGIFTNAAASIGVSATAVAGLTAGVSLLATGAYVLYRNWDSVSNALGMDTVETAAEEMDRLGKATAKTADEQKRYNMLKQEQQQIEQQRASRPENVKDMERQFGVPITEAPYDKLLEDVRNALTPAQLRAYGRDYIPERHEEIRKRSEGLIHSAQFGEGDSGAKARQLLQDLAAANPGMEGLARFSQGLNRLERPGDEAVKGWRSGKTDPTEMEREGDEAVKRHNQLLKERNQELEQQIKKEADIFEKGHDEAIRAKIEAGEQLTDDELNSGNRGMLQDYLRKKIADRLPLTEREEAGMTAEMRDQRDDLNNRDMRSLEGINARLNDNRSRIFQAMNPNQESRRMGLDQYDASIGGMTGETIADKRLQTLIKLQEENNKLLRDRAAIGAVRRRR